MFLRILLGLFSLYFVVSCSSAAKQRMIERDKLASNTGMMCDFINGDDYMDIEIELNIQMARRCDINKAFTVTNYKNSADVNGVLYCCALVKKTDAANKSESTKKDQKSDTAFASKAEGSKLAEKNTDKPVDDKPTKTQDVKQPQDANAAVVPAAPQNASPKDDNISE